LPQADPLMEVVGEVVFSFPSREHPPLPARRPKQLSPDIPFFDQPHLPLFPILPEKGGIVIGPILPYHPFMLIPLPPPSFPPLYLPSGKALPNGKHEASLKSRVEFL
jgi:hypothetical protein